MSDTSPPAGDAASEAPEARSGPGPAWTIVAPLFLALLSIGLYLPTLNYKLVYDDSFLIGNNALMTPVATRFAAAFAFFGNEYWEGVNPDHPEALRTKGQALYRPVPRQGMENGFRSRLEHQWVRDDGEVRRCSNDLP